MIGSGDFSMDTIFNEVCVLVTVAFALTLAPGLQRPELSLLSRRDQATALLVFLVLGLVEEATASHAGLLNERIVAACAAGLVAGPWVGLGVALFVTWLAVDHHGLPLGSIAPAMLGAGLAGGLLYHWRPKLAQRPLTGFCLTGRTSRQLEQPSASRRSRICINAQDVNRTCTRCQASA